jgi:hypothetical protein
MSLAKEIKEAFSFKSSRHTGESLTTESERRLLLVGITLILFVLALTTLFARTVFSSSALQSCKSILLEQEKNNCIYELANRTSNYSMCSYLSPNQGSYRCIATVAKSRKNVSICTIINSNDIQYSNCVENVSYENNNINECLLINGTNVSGCIFNIARKDNFTNIDYCNAISNTSQRSLCSSIYYYTTAVGARASNYCASLPDTTNATLLSLLVTKDNINESAATTFSFIGISSINVSPMSYCYYKVAASTGNKALCSLTRGPIQSECYGALSNTTISANTITSANDLCTSAPSYLRGICNYTVFTEKALAEENASACLLILNKTYSDTCIVQLAAKYRDNSYCSYINNTNDSQTCYSSASLGINTTTT